MQEKRGRVLERLEDYRREFPITETHTFMNHAAVSAPPTPVVNAVESVLKEFSRCGMECYVGWMRRISSV